MRLNCWFRHRVKERRRIIMRNTDRSGEVAERVRQTRQACGCGLYKTDWKDGFARSIQSLGMTDEHWDTFYEQGWVLWH